MKPSCAVPAVSRSEHSQPAVMTLSVSVEIPSEDKQPELLRQMLSAKQRQLKFYDHFWQPDVKIVFVWLFASTSLAVKPSYCPRAVFYPWCEKYLHCSSTRDMAQPTLHYLFNLPPVLPLAGNQHTVYTYQKNTKKGGQWHPYSLCTDFFFFSSEYGLPRASYIRHKDFRPSDFVRPPSRSCYPGFWNGVD